MTWRWGILGTGNIARSMAEALRLVPGAVSLAVGSRNPKTAQAFAETWELPRHYGCYEDLLADDDVDIVFIATPNSAHHDNIMAVLRAGKHVLCEKPLCASAELARACAAEARGLGLFLMEAMWTRFIPAVRQAVNRARSGEIGDISLLKADFCAIRKPSDWPNLFDADLGGGALLDLGVYPLALARDILGQHDSVAGKIGTCASGVDDMAAIVLSYSTGAIAKLRCGFREDLPRNATIIGSTGRIVLPEPFHCARKLLVESVDGIPHEVIDRPPTGAGYAHELIEVQSCLDKGMIECPSMPLADSIGVLDTIDRLKNT